MMPISLFGDVLAGVLNVIHGEDEVVNFICDAPDVKAISFVGGNKVGQSHPSRLSPCFDCLARYIMELCKLQARYVNSLSHLSNVSQIHSLLASSQPCQLDAQTAQRILCAFAFSIYVNTHFLCPVSLLDLVRIF